MFTKPYEEKKKELAEQKKNAFKKKKNKAELAAAGAGADGSVSVPGKKSGKKKQ